MSMGMTHFRKGNDRTAVGSILSHPHSQTGPALQFCLFRSYKEVTELTVLR